MRNRTWPVFLIGLGSLLGLLFLPGTAALHKTQDVYDNIRAIQLADQRTQARLQELERRVYLNSILVRELLLDSSPVQNNRYEREFLENRYTVERQILDLKAHAPTRDSAALRRLETELQNYWHSVTPVFRWSPAERRERATFFLREQQRPRRQTILAIADEIDALTTAAYRQQYQQVNLSQITFRTEIERIVGIAFAIGVLIAIGCVVRIATLESRADRQRAKTEQAEEQLRHLSTQLMHAQEEERKTLSRELHDEVGQMLTGLRMELASLEQLRDDPPNFTHHLAEAKSIAEQSLRAVRDLPALQWQARHFSKRSGIPVSVQAEGEFQNLSEEHKMCAYRVVQETLTNCARHAAAKKAQVQLKETATQLELSVTDDGRGFDTRAPRHGGLGLIGIEERVRELDGELQIVSEPGKGTHLTVRFPLAQSTHI
jgi:signal transduction histidine kinase